MGSNSGFLLKSRLLCENIRWVAHLSWNEFRQNCLSLISQVVHPNGTSSTDWSDFATTDPILSHEFNLTDFNIEITQSEDDRKRGNIFASWNHTHGCVKRYAIEVFENQDQIKGQVAVEHAPAVTNKVSVIHSRESYSEIQKFRVPKSKSSRLFQ